MYRDKKWAVPNAGCRRMHLEIPKDELILFDRRTWNKILNMEYVGTDEEIAAFEQEYKRQGVRDPLDIMKSSFYPLLAQKIKKSWQHLFYGSTSGRDLLARRCLVSEKKDWVVGEE